MLCTLLYAWEIVMGALVVSFGALCVCPIGTPLILFIPQMPLHCAIMLSTAFAALTVLTVIGTIYFYVFIGQLMRCFGRFHKNTLAAATGRATLPPLPAYPQFAVKTKRVLRKTEINSVIAFAVCFIVGFITCVITAGNFEFWHTWNWF